MTDKSVCFAIIFISSICIIPAFPFEMYQVNVGANLWAVSVNPVTNRIYVTNSGNDSVSVIDGKTNTVIKNIPVGENPTGVAVNPSTGTVYVGNDSPDGLCDCRYGKITAKHL